MTDCYCDYDPATVYNKTEPTAKKGHRCSECGRPIRSGERYERVEALWDGMWETFKTCSRCIALREFVRAHVPCLCWSHGNGMDDCMNAVDEYGHETVGLRFGALRRKVLIERNPFDFVPKSSNQ